MTPRVIYENARVIILNKPAGWLTHADGRTAAPLITDWLVGRCPAVAQVGSSAARPGIVHRLDRWTSGVMVAAKDQTTYLDLRRAFAARAVGKSYRLLVHGLIKAAAGSIKAPLGRSRCDPRRRVALGSSGRGREAVTDYLVLRSLRGATYLEAYPRTGRTHQLRAHFKFLRHPIVGDKLYADFRLGPPPDVAVARPLLHSYALSLPPLFGAPRLCLAPLPLDFFRALVFWRGA